MSSQMVLASDWFCTEESSQVGSNEVHVCGTAYHHSESEARAIALEAAYNEFSMICKYSASCHDRKFDIIPARTDCRPFAQGYKCYRMFHFILH